MRYLDDLPTDVEVTPKAISTYLGATGWELAQASEAAERWLLSDGSTRRADLLLPLDRTYDDFPLRFNEALRRLCLVHDWNVGQLATQVLSSRSDFFYIRADQASMDGSIPIKQAESMLHGASNLLFAAACSAVHPRAQFLGRRPDAAKNFIADDVRMGHTQRGSFIITIITRLQEDVSLGAEESTTPSNPAPPSEESERQVEPFSLPPFQRRVMATLATGLRSMKSLAMDTGEVTFEAAVQQGLSADLIKAMSGMTNHAGLRSLDLSFAWAPAEPSPPPQLDTVTVDRDVMPALPPLQHRLERTPPKPDTAVIFGKVTKLERGEDDDEGVITIQGIIGERTRRTARVALSGATYNEAIRAHRERRPVSAEGLLELKKGAYWLTGEITFTSGTY